jgi:hypothetical protein
MVDFHHRARAIVLAANSHCHSDRATQPEDARDPADGRRRVEFDLPGGKTVKANSKVDLAPRLAPERSRLDDVIAYDP